MISLALVLALTFSQYQACFFPPPPPACPNDKQSCIADDNGNVMQIKEVSNPLICSKYQADPRRPAAADVKLKILILYFQTLHARSTLMGGANTGLTSPPGLSATSSAAAPRRSLQARSVDSGYVEKSIILTIDIIIPLHRDVSWIPRSSLSAMSTWTRMPLM